MNIVKQILAVSLFAFAIAHTSSAGIFVFDGQGKITKWVNEEGTALSTPTTIYFYEGSFVTAQAAGADLTSTPWYTANDSGALALSYVSEFFNDYDALSSTDKNQAAAASSYNFLYQENTTDAYQAWSQKIANPHTASTPSDLQFYHNQPTSNGIGFSYASLVDPNPVPEPSTAIAMGLLGIVGFAGNRRRRRQVSVA